MGGCRNREVKRHVEHTSQHLAARLQFLPPHAQNIRFIAFDNQTTSAAGRDARPTIMAAKLICIFTPQAT
jgi:hypothetical protein